MLHFANFASLPTLPFYHFFLYSFVSDLSLHGFLHVNIIWSLFVNLLISNAGIGEMDGSVGMWSDRARDSQKKW